MKLCFYLGPYVEHDYSDASANEYDVAGTIGEALHTNSPHDGKLVWMPNQQRDSVSDYDLEDEGTLDLSMLRPNAEILAFQNAFAPELKTLVEAYGALTYRFGIVRRYQ